jgi:hypothetical protein
VLIGFAGCAQAHTNVLKEQKFGIFSHLEGIIFLNRILFLN